MTLIVPLPRALLQSGLYISQAMTLISPSQTLLQPRLDVSQAMILISPSQALLQPGLDVSQAMTLTPPRRVLLQSRLDASQARGSAEVSFSASDLHARVPGPRGSECVHTSDTVPPSLASVQSPTASRLLLLPPAEHILSRLPGPQRSLDPLPLTQWSLPEVTHDAAQGRLHLSMAKMMIPTISRLALSLDLVL